MWSSQKPEKTGGNEFWVKKVQLTTFFHGCRSSEDIDTTYQCAKKKWICSMQEVSWTCQMIFIVAFSWVLTMDCGLTKSVLLFHPPCFCRMGPYHLQVKNHNSTDFGMNKSQLPIYFWPFIGAPFHSMKITISQNAPPAVRMCCLCGKTWTSQGPKDFSSSRLSKEC